MARRRKEEKVQFVRGSGNVFADLGLPNPEVLQAKADLMYQINAVIKRRGLTLERAAEALGISEADVSDINCGHGQHFSVERFEHLLALLRSAR